MSLKKYIEDRYGSIIYQKTLGFKDMKTKRSKTKNQSIFLQKCISHHLIPKSLRLKCPVKTKVAKGMMKNFQFRLLISIKNDTRRKFFKLEKEICNLKEELMSILSNNDMKMIEEVSNKASEKMFISSKERLLKKFRILKEINSPRSCNNNQQRYIKDCVIDLTSETFPDNHKSLLNLGPKFVPTQKHIPFMDIISITESSALKLEYNKDNIAAQNLRKDILKTLKMCKPPKDNLSKSQRKALNEIKESNLISIYPFDKGSGFVRIKKEDAVQKIKDQIGEINTLAEDPTNSFAVKIKTTLSKLNKKNKFTKEEYEVIYPSDPIAPRMYGVIKAHKPEKKLSYENNSFNSWYTRLRLISIFSFNHPIFFKQMSNTLKKLSGFC